MSILLVIGGALGALLAVFMLWSLLFASDG